MICLKNFDYDETIYWTQLLLNCRLFKKGPKIVDKKVGRSTDNFFAFSSLPSSFRLWKNYYSKPNAQLMPCTKTRTTGCQQTNQRSQSNSWAYIMWGFSHGLGNILFRSTFSWQYGQVCFLPTIHQPRMQNSWNLQNNLKNLISLQFGELFHRQKRSHFPQP